MPQFINTNVMSLNTVRVLDKSQQGLQTSMERLSSGMRINHARDDAAGMAIAEGMTSQIRGMNQAVRNTMDGVSLVQTADGAMQGISEKLQRIRELAVQSANGTNSSNDRAALNLEVDNLLSEIERVASSVEFNGNKLIDGSFVNKSFQVGHTQGDTISLSSVQNSTLVGLGLSNSQAKQVGGAVLATAVNGQTAGTALVGDGQAGNAQLAAGDITITKTGGSAVNVGAIAVDSSAVDIAATINLNTSLTGVTATATSATMTGDAVGTVVTSTAISSTTFDVNGTTVTVSSLSDTTSLANADSNLAKVASEINGKTSTHGVVASIKEGTGVAGSDELILTAADGRDIKIDNFTNEADDITGFTTGSIARGGIALSSDTAFTLTDADALSGASAALGLTAGVVATGGATKVSVDTVSNANDTITRIDEALKSINTGRANLGAYQNRFEATVSDLKNNVENLSGARSRIQDADFAEETASLAKNQILQQAGMAMLAQANQLPQNVLSLLR
jgi:flagellin